MQLLSESMQPEPTKREEKWEIMVLIVLALALMGVGIILYFEPDTHEDPGSTWNSHWLLTVMHHILGKTGTCLVIFISGTLLLWHSLKRNLGKAAKLN